MLRHFDLDDDDIAARAARAMAPTTHRVLPISELNRLVDTARAAESIEAAKRNREAVMQAFYNGRAQGLTIALKFRLHWWVVACVALISFSAGRLAGI